ncbi:hypothetical protein POPTR_018G092050v4 [Populus trichocarpa]|uniref:Uncharacterized protein n=1 Tax=Populus trichocarpa TaxID=3694 RepID=A0ACC0RNC0_POPTR|nr:hypothetical protein BDE02_18G074800 [Populus trichocarpa]KAI9378437.1 hypothetical protein POPTR_018G092050v4 [Populus trichocarpa]
MHGMHSWPRQEKFPTLSVSGLQGRDPAIEGRIDYIGDEFVVNDQLMISILAGS